MRFYIVDQDGGVTATNSETAAIAACEDQAANTAVIDTEKNLDLCMSDTIEIPYQNDYPE